MEGNGIYLNYEPLTNSYNTKVIPKCHISVYSKAHVHSRIFPSRDYNYNMDDSTANSMSSSQELDISSNGDSYQGI